MNWEMLQAKDKNGQSTGIDGGGQRHSQQETKPGEENSSPGHRLASRRFAD